MASFKQNLCCRRSYSAYYDCQLRATQVSPNHGSRFPHPLWARAMLPTTGASGSVTTSKLIVLTAAKPTTSNHGWALWITSCAERNVVPRVTTSSTRMIRRRSAPKSPCHSNESTSWSNFGRFSASCSCALGTDRLLTSSIRTSRASPRRTSSLHHPLYLSRDLAKALGVPRVRRIDQQGRKLHRRQNQGSPAAVTQGSSLSISVSRAPGNTSAPYRRISPGHESAGL